MKGKNNNAKFKWLKVVGSIIFYVIILIVIAFGIVGIVGRAKGKVGGVGFFGYNAYVVVSPSMSVVHPSHFRKDDIKALGDTQFSKGELVIVRNLKEDDEIKDLDVVTFTMGGSIIIHRVVDIKQNANGETVYLTQGDANGSADGERTRDQFLGVKVGSLGKFGGTVVMFMQSGWGIAAVALTIAIALIATLIADDSKKKQVQKPIEPPDEEEIPETEPIEDDNAEEHQDENTIERAGEDVQLQEGADENN